MGWTPWLVYKAPWLPDIATPYVQSVNTTGMEDGTISDLFRSRQRAWDMELLQTLLSRQFCEAMLVID